jgi:hypothetical protein
MMQMRMAKQFLALAVLVGATVSCGDVSRQGQSPVYLVIDSLTAKRGGATTSTDGNFLLSDVITNVTSPPPCSQTNPCATIFNDVGSAKFTLALKDITNASITTPTTNNSVTLTRYPVCVRRCRDGDRHAGRRRAGL